MRKVVANHYSILFNPSVTSLVQLYQYGFWRRIFDFICTEPKLYEYLLYTFMNEMIKFVLCAHVS